MEKKNQPATPAGTTSKESESLMEKEEFVASLHQLGADYYHDKHPFHRRMYRGELSKEEIQGWVACRFYYQTRIPIKDAVILSKTEDKEVRQNWIQRVIDHDGNSGEPGGIEFWLDLAAAVGLDKQETADYKLLTPDARAAVDSYVTFVEANPLFDCVAISLTELFATGIHLSRIDTWPKNYPWIPAEGYLYFNSRVAQSRRDVAWGLDYVTRHATTPDLQARARAALVYKLGLLWDLCTAIEEGYSPGKKEWKPRLASKAQLQWDDRDEAYILLLPEKGMQLNPSAANILKLCEGKLAQREIVSALSEEFPEGNPVEINISTMIFIDDFLEKGLLE